MTKVLIHDYRTGDVIDSTTGEVIGKIFARSTTASFARTNDAGYIDRLHYAKMKPLHFDAVDPVARQLRELRLRPSFLYTARWLREHDGKHEKEKKLLDAYTKVMNILGRYRKLGLDDARIVAKLVREAIEIRPRARSEVLAAAAVYVARLLLGIIGIDLYAVRGELGLDPRDVNKVLEIARKLSVRHRVDRYGMVARIIERAAELLGVPKLEYLAKLLLAQPRLEIGGKSAKSVAAGLLYLAAVLMGVDWKLVTMKRICSTLRVSEVAVRLSFRAFAKMLGISIERYGSYGAVMRIEMPSRLCQEIERHGIELAQHVYCR